MALAPISQISNPFESYPSYWLKGYAQGTTTPILMSTDSSGLTTVAKAEISAGGIVPIGFIKTAGNVIFIPYFDEAYDLWLFPTEAEADANDTSNAIQVADDMSFFTDSDIFTTSTENLAIVFTNYADLVSGTLPDGSSVTLTAGQNARILGRVTEGDGGDNTYLIGTFGTADGGSIVDLDSGLQAKGLFPGGVYCEGQWGAIPGATDITANIQAAIDYRPSGGIFIKALPGQHVISGLDFSNVTDVTYGGDSVVGWTNIEHGAYFTPTGAIADMFAYDPGSRTNARNYLQNILINCDDLANYGVNFDNFSVVGFRNVVVVNALIDSFFLGGSNASFGADLVECYSNSPVGVGYHIQSKLVRVNTCTADGGTYSVSMSTSSGQGSVRDCNFEGASIETALIESDNNKISDNNFQAPSAASTAVRLSGSFNTITGGRMTRNGGAGSMGLLIDGGNNTVGSVTMTGVETGVQLSAANNSLDGLIIDASVDAIKEVTPGGSNAITGGSIVSGAVTIANSETTITGTNGVQDRIATANASFASGNTNDYDIGVNAETLWVDTAAGAATLTGVTGGVAGRKLRVFNKGANTLTIADLNAASLIENRIITPTGADIVIAAFGGGVALEYDDAGQRWYVSGQ